MEDSVYWVDACRRQAGETSLQDLIGSLNHAQRENVLDALSGAGKESSEAVSV